MPKQTKQLKIEWGVIILTVIILALFCLGVLFSGGDPNDIPKFIFR
jgi:hypothetical protein